MKQLLVIGYVWPEPQSSAAGARMMQLLEFFLSNGFRVTFSTTAVPTPYSEDLESKGINVRKIKLNDPEFDLFIKDLDPDVVLYDRFMMEEQFGWRVSEMCPHTLTVLDTEDLHFLRNNRQNEIKSSGKTNNSLATNELAKREIASIYRCDLSLIISEAEMELLKKEFGIPGELLFYLPFMLKEIIPVETSYLPAFEERKDFISIGNFKHAPNADAAVYLKEEIWPNIHRQLPDARMLVYGAYPTVQIQSLHSPEINFLVKGRAEDAREVVKNARVSLAPLRFGAGLKGKLTEAMECGTPTVTTLIGAEGMNINLPWNGAITATAEEFANAAVELYTSKSTWTTAVENGFNLINRNYSNKEFSRSFALRLKNLMVNLENHRSGNFTGAMLRHHYLRSTYFLSKYIEIKNRLERLQEKYKKTTS